MAAGVQACTGWFYDPVVVSEREILSPGNSGDVSQLIEVNMFRICGLWRLGVVPAWPRFGCAGLFGVGRIGSASRKAAVYGPDCVTFEGAIWIV